MAEKSTQFQLAQSIQSLFKDCVIKKIDKDNFLDIHIPSVNSSKGSHLFFNTAKGQIKLGFYSRDREFVDKVVSKSSKKIESYSQGVRLIGNPEFTSVEKAIAAAKKLVLAIDLTVPIPKKVTKATKPKKKVSSKPLQKKLKKQELTSETKDSIAENIATQVVSDNMSKNNWLHRLLDFIGKLINK